MSRRNKVEFPRHEPEGAYNSGRRGQNYFKKSTILGSSESYAATFFRENPQVEIDTKDPKTKLEELERQLAENELESVDKFQNLIRSKSMIYLIYGEDSVESFRIHAKLGAFYVETHRPQSALRHLQKAQEISVNKEIEPDELMLVALDTAESHLALRNDNSQESAKHNQRAIEALKKVQNYNTDNLDLRYRCELASARVTAAGKHPEKAFKAYEQAMSILKEQNDGEVGLPSAKLCVEISEFAEKMDDQERVQKYASMAYEIFLSLGMSGSAQIIRGKVSEEVIKECEEKYNNPGIVMDYQIQDTDYTIGNWDVQTPEDEPLPDSNPDIPVSTDV